MKMESVCVFCGSRSGRRAVYREVAERMGRVMAGRGLRLVYGGGHTGLMGAVADAALEAGGEVCGIIPESLEEKEVGHAGLDELRVVGSMHERKRQMAEEADGFVAMPGGLGTFEELLEIWTWAQLGYHRKPLAVLNVDGYFDPLIGLVDHAVDEGFVGAGDREMLLVHERPGALLEDFADWKPKPVTKWLDSGET